MPGLDLIGYGSLQQGSQCLDTNGRTSNGHMTLRRCVGQDYVNQEWQMTKSNIIKFSDGHGNHWCLALDTQHWTTLVTCSAHADQLWDYDPQKEEVVHRSTGLCLESQSTDPVLARACTAEQSQKWHFTK